MDYVDLREWLDKRYIEEGNSENKQKILHAKIFLDNAIEKLQDAGLKINPVIPISHVMGQEIHHPSYLQLTYQEASRILLVRHFIVNKEMKPTANDIAAFRKNNPLPHDGQNETKIFTELERKGLVYIELDHNKAASELLISLTTLGEETAREVATDNEYLKKIYKRSRDTKLKEFILEFIDKGRSNLFSS